MPDEMIDDAGGDAAQAADFQRHTSALRMAQGMARQQASQAVEAEVKGAIAGFVRKYAMQFIIANLPVIAITAAIGLFLFIIMSAIADPSGIGAQLGLKTLASQVSSQTSSGASSSAATSSTTTNPNTKAAVQTTNTDSSNNPASSSSTTPSAVDSGTAGNGVGTGGPTISAPTE